MNKSARERFWGKVDRSGGPDACWPWMAGKNADGYGQFWYSGTTVGAHVFAFADTEGLVEGEIVCHSCDNPPCCNPAHLFAGTHGDNARDRDTKQRRTVLRGSTNPQAKLTEAAVLEARARFTKEGIAAVRAMASEIGVYWQTLYKAIIGDTWTHLKQ